MKKTLLFILPLAAILLVALTSCNKSDKEDGDNFIVDNDSITVDDPFMQVCQHVSNINKEVKKYFKISSSGVVSIKKKLKKGTYTIKCTVTAAGNDDYQPVTKTVTFKIKVK